MKSPNPEQSQQPDLRPIEDLDRDILGLCTRINAATYELLVLVREFDERGGFLKWGLDNCAKWLAWRCDLSMNTATEKVRVAHALKFLPQLSDSFSSGELSYTKVRELTRVANRDNEGELLAFALRTTASHVAERCRELRNGDGNSLDTAARAYANRSLRIRRDHQRGMMTITVDLPMDTGELVESALDKARDDDVLAVTDVVDTSWSKRQADAFADMVRGFLSGGGSTSSSDNYLVTVHVEQSALEGKEGRSALPIESVKRLCCDSQAVVITEDKDGEPLSIGRKSRVIPSAISRAVRARDHDCCTFPGCGNRRFLHCHHVDHWSNGGETSLDNLMLLCTKHHTLVHEGGFRIEKDFNDDWFFVRPDGIAVPECGYHARDTHDDFCSYEHLSAGGLLSVAERSVSEPPPPVYFH
jgi:hypothetical protein